MANYAHPETLVETDWVKANLGKPGIKLVEIDVDTKAYDAGHYPRSRRLQLANPTPRPSPSRHHQPGGI